MVWYCIFNALMLHILQCTNVEFKTISYCQKPKNKTYFVFMAAILTIITHSYSKKFYLNIWSSLFMSYFILSYLINAHVIINFLAWGIKNFFNFFKNLCVSSFIQVFVYILSNTVSKFWTWILLILCRSAVT